MIIQDSTNLLEIISRIERLISDKKNQQPHLSDEEIIDQIKKSLPVENKN